MASKSGKTTTTIMHIPLLLRVLSLLVRLLLLLLLLLVILLRLPLLLLIEDGFPLRARAVTQDNSLQSHRNMMSSLGIDEAQAFHRTYAV